MGDDNQYRQITDADKKYLLERERRARYAKDWRERHPGYMAAKSKAWWHSHPENTARYAAKKKLQRQRRKERLPQMPRNEP